MNTNTNSVADVIALSERLANKVALTTTTETPQKIDAFFQETSESKNKTNTKMNTNNLTKSVADASVADVIALADRWTQKIDSFSKPTSESKTNTNTNNNKMKVYTNASGFGRHHTREQMETEYAHFARSRQPTDICWTWREREQGIGIMNYQEIAFQVAEWNQSGDCSIQDYNNKEVKTLDGKTWYVLVLQVLDKATGEMDEEANPMGSMSLLLFGIMVSGYTYVFETAEIRDAVAKAIQTKTPMPKRTTLPRGPNPAFHPICCFCGGFCDCPYGNSVSPLEYDEGTSGRCCNKCNEVAVLPARLVNRLDAEHVKTFAKKAGIVVAKEETPEEKALRLQAEVEVLTMKAVKKPKELSPKELRKQEEKRQLAEANAYLKAEKKRKEDYAKACGTFRTPEQLKKEREARFKVQCEAMKGSGSKRK